MWVNRIVSALALASAVLHLRMGVTATSAFVTAMALLCVYCAVDLLRSVGNRAWVMVAATSAGMLLAYSSFPTHHHTAVSQTSSMTMASAVAAVELVLATSVVFFRSRHVHPKYRPIDRFLTTADRIEAVHARKFFPAVNRNYECLQLSASELQEPVANLGPVRIKSHRRPVDRHPSNEMHGPSVVPIRI